MEQTVSPVLWQPSLTHAHKQLGITHFIELGPGAVLTNIITRDLASEGVKGQACGTLNELDLLFQ